MLGLFLSREPPQRSRPFLISGRLIAHDHSLQAQQGIVNPADPIVPQQSCVSDDLYADPASKDGIGEVSM